MEHIIHPLHRIVKCTLVPHISYVELNFVRHLRHPRLKVVTHIILLFLIAAKDANLADIRA